MRAISINLSGGSAVSGFLNPGNYVDILVTFPRTEGEETQTITLLQAVTVLAVNTRLGGPEAGPKERAKPSVTLAITPEQAERLTHSNSQGAITLTLRNDIDVTHVVTHGAMSTDLLGGKTDEKRIQIKEWKKATGKKTDGSLIIIKGPQQTKEKVR
jgi:pilus assembly protein CpaB